VFSVVWLLNVFYSLSSGTFELTLQFTEDYPNKGRDGRRVSPPPNTFLLILAAQLFCLRTRSISLHLIVSTAARSISLRLLLSDSQISLHYSRISRNQLDLVLSLVGRSIDRLRGSWYTSLYSLAEQVCFAVCFVGWRIGSLIHGSMLFLVEGRSLDLPLDSYANNSYHPIIVLELSVSTVSVCLPIPWRVHDSMSKSCRRRQVFPVAAPQYIVSPIFPNSAQLFLCTSFLAYQTVVWYHSYWLLRQVVQTNMKQLIKTFIYPAPHPL
jgi:hypothetical protein